MTANPVAPLTPAAQLMEITPWLAKQWLGQNTNNRPKKTHAIAAYARDMAAGKWKINGESIKFASNGSLSDGQNRLYACILANVPFQSWVMYGLDPSAQDTMDAGVKRSNGDQLALHGVSNANTVSTVSAAWTGWNDGRWTNSTDTTNAPVLTHSEALQFVEDHPEVSEAAQIAQATSKVLRLPPGVIGAAWMILSKIDEPMATDFFRKIREGETTGKGDPLVTLIRRAQVDRDLDRTARPGPSFYLIFRAWNAWRRGESLEKLVTLAYTGEPIPIPAPR